MSRRWPNTKHWQRLVATFRWTNNTSWRRCAAVAMNCQTRDLRGRIDRDLSIIEIKRLDAMLIDRLHRYAEHLKRRIDDVYSYANAIAMAPVEVNINMLCYERHFFPDDADDDDDVPGASPSAFKIALAQFLADVEACP